MKRMFFMQYYSKIMNNFGRLNTINSLKTNNNSSLFVNNYSCKSNHYNDSPIILTMKTIYKSKYHNNLPKILTIKTNYGNRYITYNIIDYNKCFSYFSNHKQLDNNIINDFESFHISDFDRQTTIIKKYIECGIEIYGLIDKLHICEFPTSEIINFESIIASNSETYRVIEDESKETYTNSQKLDDIVNFICICSIGFMIGYFELL